MALREHLEGSYGGPVDPAAAAEYVRAVPVAPYSALAGLIPPLDEQTIAAVGEAKRLREYAQGCVILTADDVKKVTNDLSIIARLKKMTEEKKKEYVAPVKDELARINSVFDQLLAPVLEADSILRTKVKDWTREQQRLADESRKIEEEKLALAKREAALKDGEITVPLGTVEPIAPPPAHVRTDLGTLGMVDHWTWELVDISQVPKEYLMVNSTLVGNVVRASKGKLAIAGIRIFNDPGLRVTTK